MKRALFATATAVVALAAAGAVSGVQAADLYVPQPDTPAFEAATSPEIYALLYGGIALGGGYTYEWFDTGVSQGLEDWTFEPGWALGGTIGFGTGIEGLSIEGDIFHTHRVATDDTDYVLDTTSVMANLKYTASLNDMFDLYAGAGIGGIAMNYATGTSIYSGWGLGYQVMVGANAHVTDNVAIFGELRYQNSFAPIHVTGTGTWSDDIQAPVAAALIGIKLSM